MWKPRIVTGEYQCMQTPKVSVKKFHKISLNSDNLEAESQSA